MNKTPSDDGQFVSKRHANYALFLLFVLMMFDFMDRQVVSALLPAIKAEWSLSDSRLGMMVSSVNVAIALLVLPTSVLVDRWSRKYMIGGMAVLWSLATAACGLATNYGQMLAARFIVGVGEAGYGPGGTTLVAAMYPERHRGIAMSLFHSAGAFGAVLGVILGGFIAAHWGWRAAFGVVALPGLLFAVLVFFIRDYRTVGVTVRDRHNGETRDAGWAEAITMIVRAPVLLVLFAGSTAQFFFLSVYGNWLPTFYHRVHGMTLDKAGLFTGVAILVIGVGVASGGIVVDKLSRGVPARRLLLSSVFPLLSAPLYLTAFSLPASDLQIALMVVASLLINAAQGPVHTAISDLVHPGVRSSAVGVMVLCMNVFGMALGPTLAGMLSDHYDLQTALLITSFLPLVGATCFAFVGWNFERARVGWVEPQLSPA